MGRAGCIRRKGFTLLELLLVFVILAVAFSFAAMSFGAFSGKADDASGRQALRAVGLAEQQRYQSRGQFETNTTTLAQLEDAFTYVLSPTASSKTSEVSIAVGTYQGQDAIGLAVQGNDSCQVMVVIDPSVTEWVTGEFDASSGPGCSGTAAFSHVGTGEWT